MISMFLVQCDTVDLFELDENEYNDALNEYPELDEVDPTINYYPRSSNAWVEPKRDLYFDNDQILKQFKRLFILLKFKKSFINHKIDILVDNA